MVDNFFQGEPCPNDLKCIDLRDVVLELAIVSQRAVGLEQRHEEALDRSTVVRHRDLGQGESNRPRLKGGPGSELQDFPHACTADEDYCQVGAICTAVSCAPAITRFRDRQKAVPVP